MSNRFAAGSLFVLSATVAGMLLAFHFGTTDLRTAILELEPFHLVFRAILAGGIATVLGAYVWIGGANFGSAERWLIILGVALLCLLTRNTVFNIAALAALGCNLFWVRSAQRA